MKVISSIIFKRIFKNSKQLGRRLLMRILHVNFWRCQRLLWFVNCSIKSWRFRKINHKTCKIAFIGWTTVNCKHYFIKHCLYFLELAVINYTRTIQQQTLENLNWFLSFIELVDLMKLNNHHTLVTTNLQNIARCHWCKGS